MHFYKSQLKDFYFKGSRHTFSFFVHENQIWSGGGSRIFLSPNSKNFTSRAPAARLVFLFMKIKFGRGEQNLNVRYTFKFMLLKILKANICT